MNMGNQKLGGGSMPEERVTPFNWNLKIGSRKMVTPFEKNTPFPTKEIKFSIRTTFNNQISTEFQVLKDTEHYKWHILKMSPTKRRTNIEISCKIDENGVFSCLWKGNIREVDSIYEHYNGLLSEGKYYDILGVDENAPQLDVNDAFGNKSSKFRSFHEIYQIINTAHTNIDTEDKRKRVYLKNAITDIFREWGIDEQYYGNISYLVKKFMKSTDSYWSLKEKGRGHIKNEILKKEKPKRKDLQVEGKDYVLITKDEGEEGVKYPLTRIAMIKEEEERFEIPVPPNTSSDRDVIVEGYKDNPHAYIPGLKGDATIKVKVIPIDANEIFKKIKKELKTDFKYSNKEYKDIILAIREEVRRQYQISDDVNEGRIVNEFLNIIREHAFPIPLTKDEAKEGMETPLVIIPPDSKDGDMIHVKSLEFVEVKEIPANANAIFEKIKKELKTGFKHKQKDIVKVIRGEVHRQYHESGLGGIGMRSDAAEEEIARKIMENRERYHRSGCAGVNNEKKIINTIISMLPPPIKLDITLKEAIFGCQKRGTLINPKCKICGGMGYNIGTMWNQKCSCAREINVKVPSIKTLFLNHIIPIEDGKILVKSQIRRILGFG